MNRRIIYRWKVLYGLYPYTYGVKRYGGALLIFSVLSVGAEFVTPIVYKVFINDVILKADLFKLKVVVAGYLITYFVSSLANYMKLLSKYRLINEVLYRVRKKILSNFFEIPFCNYENISIGDLKMRINDDTEQISIFLGNQTIDYLISIVTTIISTFILFSINWVLAIFAIFAIPLTFEIDNMLSKYEKVILEDLRKKQQEKSSWMFNLVQGWREVKALNLSKHETRKFYSFLHKEMLLFAKWINLWTARVLIVPKIKNECFMQFGLYLIGGLLIMSGKINIGDLLVFSIYYAMFSNAAQKLSSADADLQSKMPYIDRFMESLIVPESDSKGVIRPNDSNDIILENVSFVYPNTENEVIKKICLSIKKGERLAITGKSGSGKTTLLKLITGMLKPTQGRIFFSGIDLRQIDIEAMHKKIGFIMQENILFHTTIKENLYYGKKDATDEEIITACKKACIFDFICGLPEGFNTIIGEKGIKLSGGQRQRIVLARMFLQDIDIFIFDEATSALDQYSESIIHDAIKNISRDKTIIVVSHRKSSIMLCDKVINIDCIT